MSKPLHRPYDPCIYSEAPGSFMTRVGELWMDVRRNVWLKWNEGKYRWETTGLIFNNAPPELVLDPVAPFVGQTWYDAQNKRWKRWNGRAWVESSGGPKIKA